MPNPTVSPIRFKWVAVSAATLFGVTIFSQARVQTFGSKDVEAKAEKTNRFVVSLEDQPKRGVIKTSDNKVIARDNGEFVLNLDYRKVPRSDAFFLDLGEAAGMSGSELIEFGERTKGVRIWSIPITADQRKKVLQVKTKWRANGLSADMSATRGYPMGWQASSIVGMHREDAQISKGIELSLDKELSGSPGFTKGLVDRTGAYLPMRMESGSVKRVDGAEVVLTIDSDLQEVAAESVRHAVEVNKALSGIAIVMNPKTGDVLAMANWPTFDPDTGQGPDGKPAEFNPITRGHFEPGSTMKILTLAKAIDLGIVGPNWHRNCTGVLKIGPYKITCEKHHGSAAHGPLDLKMAIARSCNVSAAQWAYDIGFWPYEQYIRDLGLMDEVKFGLPTSKGSLFIEEVAKTQELMCWGFGQSMGVTPLALAASCTALGNEGIWMKPRLIKSINGKETPTQEGKRVFSPETASQVVGYMEAVIDSDRGTGKSLRIPGYRLAGKTGTAQRMGRGGGNVANFVGFIPAQDPKAVVLVMIDNPTAGKIYGADVAGPVFSDLAREVIAKYNLPKAAVEIPTVPIIPSGTQKPVKKLNGPSVEVDVKPQVKKGQGN